MRDVLILPCETRVREFDAKLLLACHAVERGFDVIVGWKRSIDLNVRKLPLGIYVGKGVTNRNLLMYRILPRLGGRLGRGGTGVRLRGRLPADQGRRGGTERTSLPVRLG